MGGNLPIGTAALLEPWTTVQNGAKHRDFLQSLICRQIEHRGFSAQKKEGPTEETQAIRRGGMDARGAVIDDAQTGAA